MLQRLSSFKWFVLFAFAAWPVEGVGQEDDVATLRTAAERLGFVEATSHEAMLQYLSTLRRLGADLTLGSYGTTVQGRDLPWLLFSRPGVTSPAEAHASGKPVLLLGANVHGFNPVVREALLMLARDLATPGSEMNALLDEVIVLVVPSKNPDGREAGSRFNARGADLNRDYMALHEPESAAFVGRLLNHWRPHLSVDGHDGGDVQYGGAHPYHLLLQGPGLAGADPALANLVDTDLLPHLMDRLEAEGFPAFYWSRGHEDAWILGGSAPRMGRNYGGLSGIVTLLFEVTGWTGLQGGVAVARQALRELLLWAADDVHGHRLVETVQGARVRSATWPPVAGHGATPVEEEMQTGALRPSWVIPDPEREGSFLSVTDGEFRYRAVATRARARPWAWVIPPEAQPLVDLLHRHRIQVERLTDNAVVDAHAYTLAGVHWEEGLNHRVAAPRLQVEAEIEVQQDLPAGSWIVRSAQPLGRVAAHLLEVETVDSATWWGYLTPLLPLHALGEGRPAGTTRAPVLFPVFKLMEPTPLSLEVLATP